MRLTFDKLRVMARQILTVKSAELAKATDKGVSAEDEIKAECLKAEYDSIGSALAMLGLVTDDERNDIKKSRVSKKSLKEIAGSELWTCGSAKTDTPISVNL